MTERPTHSVRTALLIAALAMTVPRSLLAQDAGETKKPKEQTSISGDLSYVSFADGTDPWRLASVSYGQRGAAGSLIGRLNFADRFRTTGIQAEVDAYPRINEKVYLYLNTGYSSASIFPAWRFGGEVFTSLPNAYEASIGFRQLRFSGVPVTLLTGAVGKYTGNYWFSLRPYVRVTSDGVSASAGLTARRYYEDGDHWWGGSISYGSSPTERLTPDAIARTHAFSIAINGSTGLTQRVLGTWSLGRDSEQLTPTRTRESITVSAGLKFTYDR
jgi:YaiO family outer membrane protein